MAEKVPAAPTISDMLAALVQLGNLSRALNHAQTLVDGLANAEQVGRELDAANAKKRAELEKRTDDILLAAGQQATNQADAIVKAARELAAGIVADARAEAEKHAKAVEAKQAEHDAIAEKLSALRQHAKSLAG